LDLDISHSEGAVPVPGACVTTASIARLWELVPHLESLDVSFSPALRVLPLELLKLPRLTTFIATPTLFLFPPPEVVVDGYDSVRQCLKDAQSSGIEHFP
jgi:hypothetical protein